MLWNSYDAHCRCSTWVGEYAPKPQDGHKGLGWGSTCSNLDSQSCALTPNCDNCRWSWPIDDPLKWGSSDAECRCASEIEIDYGNDCASITDQLCSMKEGDCNACKWSWDRNDPLTWNSDSAKCRCVEDRYFYKYGWKCSDRRVDREMAEAGTVRQECDYFVSYPFGDGAKFQSDQAKCRCLPEQRDPGYYEYGRTCKKTTSGLCKLDGGCDDCQWSWPRVDDDGSKSVEAMCRCNP